MKQDFLAVVSCAALLAGALACATAEAQVIYRCGNTYTRVPCADGKVIDSSDPRSAAQRAEARRSIATQKRQAAEMERDRRRDEAAIKPAAAGSLNPSRAASAAGAASAPKKPARKKLRRPILVADDKDFIAGVPAAAKTKAASP